MKTINTAKACITSCRYHLLVLLLSFVINNGKAQVPKYNSYPSASAVLFLDFDGHTVDETVWNYDGPIYCGGSGLNNTQITQVFNRVAEDYRPFDINVTTDSTKFWSAPPNKRMRLILTVTSEWYGPTGGVAFTGSFAWGDQSPCFVFTALLNYNTKNIAEAAAHELGHTLGLFHQSTYDGNCIKVSDYNYGNGSGEIGWAPIMGVGYYQNLTLWNNGPNSYGCTNYQNDLDIITTNNGFGYRNDDHGNTIATASPVAFTATQFSFSGVIEKNTDVDMMKFVLPINSRFELNAVPYNVGTGNAGSDLDMQITLYNEAGVVLRVYNPSVLLSSVIDTVINAGTYYIRTEGRGNMYAPDYASLGSYSLQGKYTGGVLPLRRLELRGNNNGGRHQLNWLIEADEQVTDIKLEYSTDGRHFEVLRQLLPAERSYNYAPFVSTDVLYRVNVQFDNGHQYYSNIINLQVDDKQRPRLVSNIVNTSSLGVASPAQFDYSIYDMNGRVLLRGKLSQGAASIPVSFLSAGMYLMEFSRGSEVYVEKFIRK